MSLAAVEAVSDAQRGLAAALDGGSALAIEAAAQRLARAVQALGAKGAWQPTPELRALLRRALAEGEATRIRTRYLAEHGRRRLTRLQALMGDATRYGRQGRYI